MNKPVSEGQRITSRRWRRGFVAAQYLSLVAAAVLLVGFADSYRAFSFGLALFLLAFLLHFKLVLFDIQGLTQEKVTDLDEREAGIRDRAYSRAYVVFGVLVGLGLTYVAVATSPVAAHDGISLPMPDLLLLNGFFVHLFLSLPIAIMAWTEPSSSRDEN